MGRANELYIRGGYNVYPAEVEGGARGAIPPWSRWRWSGLPTRSSGRSGWPSWCRPPDGPLADDQLLADLRSAARASLADYKAPDRVVVVDGLPMTSMMKVDKRSLADRADLPRAAGPAR